MNTNDIKNLADLAARINFFGDDFFWEPLTTPEAVAEFDALIAVVDESQSWKKERNRDKGLALETFSAFLFSRFGGASVKLNRLVGGNETDVEISLNETLRPAFMNDFIGPKMVCECKNKKSESIDVGMVSKLFELLGTRGSRFGIFISILGLGGTGWKFGEGKRKKLFIESKREKPIISFTVNELRILRDGNANFYTMIKQKVRLLFDEIDDETPGVPSTESHPEYSKYIIEIVQHLRKCELIDTDESKRIYDRIVTKYGVPSDE